MLKVHRKLRQRPAELVYGDLDVLATAARINRDWQVGAVDCEIQVPGGLDAADAKVVDEQVDECPRAVVADECAQVWFPISRLTPSPDRLRWRDESTP